MQPEMAWLAPVTPTPLSAHTFLSPPILFLSSLILCAGCQGSLQPILQTPQLCLGACGGKPDLEMGRP